jgi:hypothetical protein
MRPVPVFMLLIRLITNRKGLPIIPSDLRQPGYSLEYQSFAGNPPFRYRFFV